MDRKETSRTPSVMKACFCNGFVKAVQSVEVNLSVNQVVTATLGSGYWEVLL